MKRFYKNVAAVQRDGGHQIELDGKVVRTPLRKILAVPSSALGQAIADEWASQKETIKPHSMPMMQLAATALDRIAEERASVASQIAAYAGSDLVCYRADQPVDLTVRQNETWQPLIDWAKSRYGTGLVVTTGITAVAQPDEALAAFADAVNAHDDFTMAALSTVTALTGSLVIALALSEGYLNGEQAFEAAVLDETFQIERWGLDYEAEDRRISINGEIMAAERFLQLYRAG